MNHAIEGLKADIEYWRAVIKESNAPKKVLTKFKRILKDKRDALSLLEGASEWWACAYGISKTDIRLSKTKKWDCKRCEGGPNCKSCPGPVKYLIAKGGK